jgi:hypothetical protein
MKNWLQFNEGKNYGDLYYCFKGESSEDVLYESLLNILNKGIGFTKRETLSTKSDNRNVTQPMGVDGKTGWNYITGDYLISTSRSKKRLTWDKLSLVLDGESISNNYKIQPFDIKSPINKFLASKNKDRDMPISDYMALTGRSRNYEEKIVSKKPGYLSPKYIKQIVLNKPSEEFERKVRSIDSGIDIKVIK